MNKLFLGLLMLTFLFSCQQEVQEKTPVTTSVTTPAEWLPEWEHDRLLLLPLIAEADFIRNNQASAELENLQNALQDYGFRITEKKPFGRFNDRGAVSTLTVQNKTEQPVFLMAGEIVQGGKQDRVIAEDQVVAARSITDVPVFCVEQGRWEYQEEEPSSVAEAQQKKVFAFTGYYQVASNDLRHTVTQTKNQSAIWDKVGEVTSVHNAESGTSAYAGLEASEAFTKERDDYLRFFTGKFAEQENMVGILAISGDRILGVDVFGAPALLQRQYEALLHSYITDAITNGATPSISPERVQHFVEKINAQIAADPPTYSEYKGSLVHFTSY